MPSHKNFQEALNETTIMNLQIVLNAQNNPHWNQAAQKILAKLFLPKQIQNRTFETEKNPLIIPVTRNPEVFAAGV